MPDDQTPDVQPPEFIVVGITPDGKRIKAPFLIQRPGETREELIARAKRVEEVTDAG